jgi:IS30 family transposase
MKGMRRSRRLVSASERAEIWRRWRAGASYAEIMRLLQRSKHAVWDVLKHSGDRGGLRSRARARNPRHLSQADREEVSRGLANGLSYREIGRRLRRSASTVAREVARNGGRWSYRAQTAERRARSRMLRPKTCKLAVCPRLRRLVAAKLRRRWSPQQISAWLRRQNPTDMTMQVSHETIYRSLFVQARGVLKAELLDYLRSPRHARRPRSGGRPERRGKIVDAISIRERPAEVADRAVPGHWEGDLLVGTHRSYMATLVERSSRFVMLVKVPNKRSEDVVTALIKHARKLPDELRRSLTWDRGLELAQHKRFSLATDIKVYFCDPHSPWQRGTNENTNGLLRQYFPKSQSVSQYTQADLNRIARELNERPRQTLGFRTPAEILNTALQ